MSSSTILVSPQAFPLHMTAKVLGRMMKLGKQLIKQDAYSTAEDAKRLAVWCPSSFHTFPDILFSVSCARIALLAQMRK